MGDTRRASRGAQRQSLQTVLTNYLFGRLEQGFAQIAVVIGVFVRARQDVDIVKIAAAACNYYRPKDERRAEGSDIRSWPFIENSLIDRLPPFVARRNKLSDNHYLDTD